MKHNRPEMKSLFAFDVVTAIWWFGQKNEQRSKKKKSNSVTKGFGLFSVQTQLLDTILAVLKELFHLFFGTTQKQRCFSPLYLISPALLGNRHARAFPQNFFGTHTGRSTTLYCFSFFVWQAKKRTIPTIYIVVWRLRVKREKGMRKRRRALVYSSCACKNTTKIVVASVFFWCFEKRRRR